MDQPVLTLGKCLTNIDSVGISVSYVRVLYAVAAAAGDDDGCSEYIFVCHITLLSKLRTEF